MFQEGDLVKWYELYGDISIVRDSGLGVITSVREYDYFEKEETIYIYRVYRNKHNDYMNFEKYKLESIKEKK